MGGGQHKEAVCSAKPHTRSAYFCVSQHIFQMFFFFLSYNILHLSPSNAECCRPESCRELGPPVEVDLLAWLSPLEVGLTPCATLLPRGLQMGATAICFMGRQMLLAALSARCLSM